MEFTVSKFHLRYSALIWAFLIIGTDGELRMVDIFYPDFPGAEYEVCRFFYNRPDEWERAVKVCKNETGLDNLYYPDYGTNYGDYDYDDKCFHYCLMKEMDFVVEDVPRSHMGMFSGAVLKPLKDHIVYVSDEIHGGDDNLLVALNDLWTTCYSMAEGWALSYNRDPDLGRNDHPPFSDFSCGLFALHGYCWYIELEKLYQSCIEILQKPTSAIRY